MVVCREGKETAGSSLMCRRQTQAIVRISWTRLLPPRTSWAATSPFSTLRAEPASSVVQSVDDLADGERGHVEGVHAAEPQNGRLLCCQLQTVQQDVELLLVVRIEIGVFDQRPKRFRVVACSGDELIDQRPRRRMTLQRCEEPEQSNRV